MVYFPVVCAQFVLSFSAGNSPEKEHEGLVGVLHLDESTLSYIPHLLVFSSYPVLSSLHRFRIG